MSWAFGVGAVVLLVLATGQGCLKDARGTPEAANVSPQGGEARSGKGGPRPGSAAGIRANEAATIASIRTIISAQAAYQSANQGLYESRLECLSDPMNCIPGYKGPPFLVLTVDFVERSCVRQVRAPENAR